MKEAIREVDERIKEVLESYSNEKLFFVIEEKLTKEEIFKKMVHNLKENSDKLEEENDFYDQLIERENTGATSIGDGIALPHSRFNGVKGIVMSMALLKNGAENYEPIDGEPIKLVIMIGAPKEQGKQYLGLVAAVARIFLNDEYRKNVLNSKTAEEFKANVGAFK